MGTRNNCSTPIEPLGGARVVEGGRLGVQLHVPWVDTGTVDPWVVQVALSALNQEDLELVVQVCQPCVKRSQDHRPRLELGGQRDSRPAGTHPELPPPQTMISTSSGIVMAAVAPMSDTTEKGFKEVALLDQEQAEERESKLKRGSSWTI